MKWWKEQFFPLISRWFSVEVQTLYWAFKGDSLRSLRLDNICINREYLIDVASLNKLFSISILIYSLSGRFLASTLRIKLDSALYASVTIQMALVFIDSKAAQWLFRCLFLPWKRYDTEHKYVSYSTITAK